MLLSVSSAGYCIKNLDTLDVDITVNDEPRTPEDSYEFIDVQNSFDEITQFNESNSLVVKFTTPVKISRIPVESPNGALPTDLRILVTDEDGTPLNNAEDTSSGSAVVNGMIELPEESLPVETIRIIPLSEEAEFTLEVDLTGCLHPGK